MSGAYDLSDPKHPKHHEVYSGYTDLDDDDRALIARRGAEGLCERCGENAALPEEDWCGPCVLEVETALAEVEAA